MSQGAPRWDWTNSASAADPRTSSPFARWLSAREAAHGDPVVVRTIRARLADGSPLKPVTAVVREEDFSTRYQFSFMGPNPMDLAVEHGPAFMRLCAEHRLRLATPADEATRVAAELWLQAAAAKSDLGLAKMRSFWVDLASESHAPSAATWARQITETLPVLQVAEFVRHARPSDAVLGGLTSWLIHGLDYSFEEALGVMDQAILTVLQRAFSPNQEAEPQND